MARDLLEQRGHKPTIPTDTNDPPRFAQFVEATKDAFVEELRLFFAEAQSAERISELPTVEKYALGFAPSTDPYETTVQIVQEFSDVSEETPHVAVLAAAGNSRRLTVGRPFVAHTQTPPRVETTNQEPYALANAQRQVSTLTINSAAVGAYTVEYNGIPFTYPATAADTVESIALGLFTVLSNGGLGSFAQLALASTTVISLTAFQPGVAFTLVVTSGAMTSATPTPAGAGTEIDTLVFRTVGPHGQTALTSVIPFRPQDFPTATPITTASAARIAKVFNDRALYARARVVDQGGTNGLRFEVGGPLGGIAGVRRSEIEILAASSQNLVTALGLADTGASAAGDSISGTAPAMALNVLGAGFTAAMVGRYVTIDGAPSGDNDGRFLVTAVPSGDSLEYENEDGVAEAFIAGSWFVGFRDDSSNPARPVMNRYHAAWDLQVHIEVITEDPNTRRELLDLVFFSFWLEERHFTLYGRSIFDEDVVDGNGNPHSENYQISVHSEIRSSGDTDMPRPDDNKDRIYVSRIEVPVSTLMYIDRPVLVTFGPKTGQSFTLEGENVQPDDSLPLKS
jgi:hypothetical protein